MSDAVNNAEMTEQPIPLWKCEFAELPQKVTVGDIFELRCHGDSIIPLQERAQIQFIDEAKDQTYGLHILKVIHSDVDEARFAVTGYKPGDYKESFVISDSTSAFQVEEMAWSVSSVIPKDQKPEPYGPFGPYGLSFPVWFWASLGLIVLLVLLAIVRKYRKHKTRQRIINELSTHQTALGPFHQFNKDVRQLDRKYTLRLQTEPQQDIIWNEYLKEIDYVFRMYLVRELLVPAVDWSSRETLKDIKAQHRDIYNDVGTALSKVLRELDRGKAREDNLYKIDCEQMIAMVRKVAGHIHRSRKVQEK